MAEFRFEAYNRAVFYQMRRKTPSFKSEMKGATAKVVSDF
jgi:hypothetical protein